MTNETEKEKHEHDFKTEIVKDEQMLYGEYEKGVCSCGTQRLHLKVEIRWFLNGLIKFEGWKKKREVESLTPEEVVYLIKKNQAIVDYQKFTEEHAKLFLNNLDKFL